MKSIKTKYIHALIYCKQFVFSIFELNQSTSISATRISRFEFLDGYRGSLAIVVAIAHTIQNNTCEIFNSTLEYASTYGVSGFFMLSAFLLTYRLLEDLNKTLVKPRVILLHFSKYFIRRLFRIYFVYVIFIVALKYGPHWIRDPWMFSYKSDFLQMVTLGNAGRNHLWTIPVEIKYYIFIPIFCLVCRLLERYIYAFWAICVIWTIYDQVYNYFGLTNDQILWNYSGSHELRNHFFVFFIGSELALTYYLIIKSKNLMDLIKNEWIQKSFNLISILIGVLGLYKNWRLVDSESDFAYRSRAALFWSGSLLFTLLSQPNVISNFFGSSLFWKSVGKCSFSFYLLHVGVATAVIKQLNTKSDLKLVAVTIAINYVISIFTFYLIENTLIRLANHFCARLDGFFENGEKKLIEDNIEIGSKYEKPNTQSTT